MCGFREQSLGNEVEAEQSYDTQHGRMRKNGRVDRMLLNEQRRNQSMHRLGLEHQAMALASGYGSLASICIGTGSSIWHHFRPRASVNSTKLNSYINERLC